MRWFLFLSITYMSYENINDNTHIYHNRVSKSFLERTTIGEIETVNTDSKPNHFMMLLYQGWANYGLFGNFSRPPSFNGQQIFIGLPSLYVIRSLYKSISNQFKFKINDASVVVRTFWPFENLDIIMRPLQKKVCPPLSYTLAFKAPPPKI